MVPILGEHLGETAPGVLVRLLFLELPPLQRALTRPNSQSCLLPDSTRRCTSAFLAMGEVSAFVEHFIVSSSSPAKPIFKRYP